MHDTEHAGFTIYKRARTMLQHIKALHESDVAQAAGNRGGPPALSLKERAERTPQMCAAALHPVLREARLESHRLPATASRGSG